MVEEEKSNRAVSPDGPAITRDKPLEGVPTMAGVEPAEAAAVGDIGGTLTGRDGRGERKGAALDHAVPALKKKKSWVDSPITVGVILTLGMPSVIEQLVGAAIGFTDSVVAGHTGDTDAIRAASAAAVTAMTFISWLGGLMSQSLGVGASAIIARSIGAGRLRLANRIAGTVCAAAFVLGLFVALLFYFGAHQFAWLFGLQGMSADFAVQYLHIMSWTICVQIAAGIGQACLRGAGDTVRPLMVTMAMCLMNGVASPALTFGWWGLPKWGVQGNAMGTLLSYIVSGIFTFGFLLHGDAGLKLRLSHFRFLWHHLACIMKIGIPSCLEGLLPLGRPIPGRHPRDEAGGQRTEPHLRPDAGGTRCNPAYRKCGIPARLRLRPGLFHAGRPISGRKNPREARTRHRTL